MNMNNGSNQMELGFDHNRVCPPISRRQKRLSRASWWFARMRQVVDHAIDWTQPAPTPRPEQICFKQIFREPFDSNRESLVECHGTVRA